MTVATDHPERKLILALLCVASFSVVFNNLIITPLLPSISEDLGVRVAVGGLLVTCYAIVGGVAAIFSGPLIDKIGRRPVVVAGMSVLTVATVLSAIAPNFATLIAARTLAGLGVACLTPAVFAAVGDYFSYAERGRAMSWVISANTSASILGVPAGALISGLLSWRWSFVLMAVLSLLFTALIFVKLPKDSTSATKTASGLREVGVVLRDLQTMMSIFSSYLSTAYWFVFTTYMGAYFHDEFGVAKWALGGLTMIMGIGVLLGSHVGGRVGDRRGKRPVILVTSLVCGIFITMVTTVSPHPVVGLTFLFIFSTFSGARFASAQAILTEMDPARRGTVMALNVSGQQFGIVTGSALGGFGLSIWGYTAIGPISGALALASFVSYAAFVNENRFKNSGPPASETGAEPKVAAQEHAAGG